MPSSLSTWARTSARPASRPSARPCSKASLWASACRSASPLTVGNLWPAEPLPMSGAAQTLTVVSDKLGAALAAETDGAFLRQALRDHHDLLLRRLDLDELHGTARLHVVLENFRGALRHVLEYLLLHFGLGPAQGDGQRIGTDLAQKGLDAAVVHIQEIVEDEQQILDLLMHLRVGLLDLAQLLVALVAFAGIQDVRDRSRPA